MKPLISICLPTYNRIELLEDCLQKIIYQIENNNLQKLVEILISDNNSSDSTQKRIQRIKLFYKYIHYYKNRRNIGGIQNTIRAASYSKAEYIWFFSDDDLQNKNALQKVIHVIERHKPDGIYCNLDLVSKDSKKIIDRNLFRIKTDFITHSRFELFKFLENTFFLPFDWYVTCLSCTIIKKTIFDTYYKKNELSHNKYSIFPHEVIYYMPTDLKIYFIAKSLVNFRSNNRSFGSKDEVAFLAFWYKALSHHYKRMYSVHCNFMSIRFKTLLFIKIVTRDIRLLLLTLFKIDISSILVKLFYS